VATSGPINRTVFLQERDLDAAPAVLNALGIEPALWRVLYGELAAWTEDVAKAHDITLAGCVCARRFRMALVAMPMNLHGIAGRDDPLHDLRVRRRALTEHEERRGRCARHERVQHRRCPPRVRPVVEREVQRRRTIPRSDPRAAAMLRLAWWA
jgi:hypothetical protein